MNCPNCSTLLPEDAQKCPNCQAQIVITSQVIATGGGVAAGRDINAPVFTGPINAPVTITFTAPESIPEPPPPDRPPLVSAFIGREQELAYFGQKLAAANLAVIAGIAGTGKTTLASVLARRSASPGKIFWYTFHPDEGIDAILWRLAAFLDSHGQPDPWQTLHRARNIPREEIFRYLIQAIRRQGFLLCLDDFQHVDEDPLIGQLVGELRAAVASGDIAMIITSRRMPAFVIDNQFDPLEGLSLEDTTRLMQARGLDLTPDLFQRLHETTEGNAELLILAVHALQSSRSPEQLIENLPAAHDIERFLLDEVDRGLTELERALLSAAAALLGYSATRESLETLIDAGVRRPLADLLRSHLLEAAEGRYGSEYSLHAMLQRFYYDMLGPSQKRFLHLRAAAFYEARQPDLFRAALYFERGAEPAKAAGLICGSLEDLINRGQAHALARLLERIPSGALSGLSAAQAALSQGELYAFLGDNELADAAFQSAWSALGALQDDPTIRGLRARVCHSMALFLQFEDPQAALEWLRRGLDVLSAPALQPSGLDGAAQGADANLLAQRARLHIRAGSVQSHLGNYEDANTALREGLALLPAGQPTLLTAIARRCLGEVAFNLGEVKQAISFAQQSLETSRALGDKFEIANALIDLGVFRHTADDWPGGIAAFEEALVLARQLGSRKQVASLELNLGAALTYLADDSAAQTHLRESLAMAEQSSLAMVRALALYRMADLHIRREEWQPAETCLDQAEAAANEINFRPAFISIYRARAEVKIGLGQPLAGAAQAASALALATELGESLEAAITMRAQAQADLAQGNIDRAVATLRQSLAGLEDEAAYEAARTREILALALHAQSHPDEAREQLNLARAAYQALGAKRDLARIEQRWTMDGTLK